MSFKFVLLEYLSGVYSIHGMVLDAIEVLELFEHRPDFAACSPGLAQPSPCSQAEQSSLRTPRSAAQRT